MFKITNNISLETYQHVWLGIEESQDHIEYGQTSEFTKYDFFEVNISPEDAEINGRVSVSFNTVLTNVTVGVAGSTSISVDNEGLFQTELYSFNIYFNNVMVTDGLTSIEFYPREDSNFKQFKINIELIGNQ